MFRTLASLAALVLLSGSVAHADFIGLVDDFDTPSTGAQNADGSTVAIPSPPNYFANRTMAGSFPGVMAVTNSGLTTTFLRNESGYIEWDSSTETRTFENLILTNFNTRDLRGISWEVSVNGTAVGGGVMNNGRFRFAPTSVGPNDSLRITFTSNSDGLGIFQGASMISTPEPTAIGLLGLVMFGGTCRYRRRRVTTA